VETLRVLTRRRRAATFVAFFGIAGVDLAFS
jgi:hypothetical protein